MTVRDKLEELQEERYSGRVFVKIVKDSRCLEIAPLDWLQLHHSKKIEQYLDLEYTGFRVVVDDNRDDAVYPFIETVLLFEVE